MSAAQDALKGHEARARARLERHLNVVRNESVRMTQRTAQRHPKALVGGSAAAGLVLGRLTSARDSSPQGGVRRKASFLARAGSMWALRALSAD